MEHYGKEKKIYKGIWISFVAMLVVPVALFLLFYFAIMGKITANNNYAFYISLAFSGLLGFMFGLVCILSGLIHDYFVAMINRIRDTIEFYGFFSKRGLSYYFTEFVHGGGPIMWGFLLLMSLFAVISVIGFANFFYIYNA